MRVLLVEDDSIDEAAVRRLMPADTTVVCVQKLAEAIDLVQREEFNLVLDCPTAQASRRLRRYVRLHQPFPRSC